MKIRRKISQELNNTTNKDKITMSLYLTDLQVEADVYVIYSPCELDILDAIDISEDTAD